METASPHEGAKGFEDVTAQELQVMIKAGEDILLLDVRELHEYNGGRVPGACLLSLGELEAKHILLKESRKTVVICRSGSRSSKAAALLAKKGFISVYNLTGGMLSWPGDLEKGKGGCRL